MITTLSPTTIALTAISPTTIDIPLHDVRPGDVVVDGGHRRRITDVRRGAGWSWPVAVDGTGWAIALGRRPVTVARSASHGELRP